MFSRSVMSGNVCSITSFVCYLSCVQTCTKVHVVYNPVPASSVIACSGRSYMASGVPFGPQLSARCSHYRAGPHPHGFVSYVPRRIQITVDLLSARWTSPYTVRELQILL